MFLFLLLRNRCLSGLGAKSWAESNGIPTCDENLMVSGKFIF